MKKSQVRQRIRKARVPEGFSRTFNAEKTVIKNLINGFEQSGTKGENFLENVFGEKIDDVALYNIICLGMIYSKIIKIKYPRNYRRSKCLSIKWFDENIDKIEKEDMVFQFLSS